MENRNEGSEDQRVNETMIPFLLGFFLFLVWFTTDFPLGDKFLMSSLILGMEALIAIGLAPHTIGASRKGRSD